MANKPSNRPVMRPTARHEHTAPTVFVPTLTRNNDHAAMEKALGEGTLPTTEAAAKPSGFRAAEIARAAEDYQVGQLYLVPLHKLQRSENNARFFYPNEELSEMAESLKKNGQQQPALGYVKNGKVLLTDGQKRLNALVNAGLFELEVKIVTPPESEANEYETSRLVNLERSTQTGIDDAYKWRALLDRKVYDSQDHLANRLGLKKDVVSKILGISRIPEHVIRLMVNHQKTSAWTIAYAISTMFDPKRIEEHGQEQIEITAGEVIDDIIKNDLNKKQVELLISKRFAGPKRRAQPESSPIKFGDGKGHMKVFPSRGQLDLSIRGLSDSKVTELKELIERALAGQLPV